jgi:hypothetical protein
MYIETDHILFYIPSKCKVVPVPYKGGKADSIAMPLGSYDPIFKGSTFIVIHAEYNFILFFF